MQWAGRNTNPHAIFLVVEGRDFFAARDAEWFPALTGRISAAAVQGYEWVDQVDFAQRIAAFRQLQQCGFADAACVDSWSREHAVQFSHLYVLRHSQSEATSPPCCQNLIDSLAASGAYELAFENSDVRIYERLP